MEFLTQLWLPILVAGVAVFVLSSISHMALPFHRRDHRGLPGEDEVLALLREKGTAPGQYMFPHADSYAEWGTPEMQAKWKQGPIGIVRIGTPESFNMGKNLLLWFLYCVAISVFAAYATWHGVGGAGAEYLAVFRLVATVTLAAYGAATVVDSIWKQQPWGVTLRFAIDGVVYAMATAGIFAWLWPAATGVADVVG